MSIEVIRLEIQQRQSKIQALRHEIDRLEAEKLEIYRQEDLYNVQIGASHVPLQQERISDEIRELEGEIEDLIAQAQQEQAQTGDASDLSPLEMLGMAAIMRADGNISDEKFNQLLEQVRHAVSGE
jgi:hypothetical protein